MPKAHRYWSTPSVLALAAALVAAVVLYQAWSETGASTRIVEPDGSGLESIGVVDVDTGERAILEAFRLRASDQVVEAGGRVVRLLADDTEGARHQRFIVRLPGGHTLLLSHNIDLAPRIPISVGDDVTFRGEYEWNDQGGVIHWTHHDPQGLRPGGWIQLDENVYR